MGGFIIRGKGRERERERERQVKNTQKATEEGPCQLQANDTRRAFATFTYILI